jgi:hypothetical protein
MEFTQYFSFFYSCTITIKTLKPRFNKPEGTKDSVLYNRVFVTAGFSNMKLTTEGHKRRLLLEIRNFVIEGVVVLRFPCTTIKFENKEYI